MRISLPALLLLLLTLAALALELWGIHASLAGLFSQAW
jgi:hypothetical protein